MKFEDYYENVCVVGFCGHLKAGKSLAAGFVVDVLGFTKVSFAEGVKQIAMEQFGWDGVKDDRGRVLLQRIGTDCGRMYNSEIWVGKTTEQIEHLYLRKVNRLFVIDDVRFDNEANFIHQFKNSLLIRIDREWAKDELSKHASEKGISPELVDAVVMNEGTKDDLGKKVIDVIEDKLNKKGAQ